MWTRLLRGVMYAIPPDVAYARYWHWAEEDLVPGHVVGERLVEGGYHVRGAWRGDSPAEAEDVREAK